MWSADGACRIWGAASRPGCRWYLWWATPTRAKAPCLNALSSAGVVVQDKLFSTLDPVTRRIWLPGGGQMLLTDTVGFIHKLPPTVVAAFGATLEELREADLLLHVVDITHPKAPEQAEVVETTLGDLGLTEAARLFVVNKDGPARALTKRKARP